MKKESEHPGGGERYRAIERAMERFDYGTDALLEALNATQETFGHLPEDVMRHISDRLDVPLSRVYGVATFYSMYSLEPVGKKHCLICGDPACAIAGSREVLEAARASADGQVTVERVTCLGLCDQAPAALMNGTAYVDLKADNVEALLKDEATRSRVQVTGEPRVMTRLIGELEPTDLEAHRAEGSFTALARALTEMTPEEVIEQVKMSGLAGRGGAGFPTGLKWQFTRGAEGSPKYVVCNFDESEPGTFKDRVLMQGDPYRAIEGLVICGYSIGAEQGYIFVRGEYPEATQAILEATGKLYEAGLLGKGVLGADFNFDVTVRRGAGAYICGEETALFEAIEGKRGFPRSKPPFPTTHGLFGKPTAINNVETLALIPDIVLNGGEWLRQWGTEESVGVKLFCISGHVNQAGVVEAPFGTTVRELIERYGGGFKGEPQAILMGGAAGGFLHPDNLDTPLTNEDLNPLDAPIGSGVIMVFNQSVDLWEVLEAITHFFVHETCGQCVPCRIGTNQINRMVGRIAGGDRSPGDLARLEETCIVLKKSGVCGLGQTAPSPVLSFLKHCPVG